MFITQNGDWPAQSDKAEFRFFGCDGLVCINPEYFERNADRYRCALIPNGVDLDRFHPGPPERERFDLPAEGPIVLMVSALIPSKNVAEGIAAVARVPGATLVVAGDGPLRDELHKLAGELLPGRFRQLTVPAADMPALYRSADAFMHLSLDESFGNVFVEAMATRPADHRVRHGENPLDHRRRWVFPGKSHCRRAFSRPWVRACERAGQRSKAVERASAFGWAAIARRYESFFAQVIA